MPRTESLGNWDGPMDMVPCFASRKYLYQKEAKGMDSPEMYSVTRSNNPTYLCEPSKYPVSREVG